jgi:hypothetical protein
MFCRKFFLEFFRSASVIKAQSDDAWIQQVTHKCLLLVKICFQPFPSANAAVWNRQVTGSGIRNRAWPPPENGLEKRTIEFGGTKNLENFRVLNVHRNKMG